MDIIIPAITNAVVQTLTTLTHNWPYLVISVIAAVLMKLYLDPKKVSSFFIKYKNAGVIGATTAAVATPLCSCGTTAIVIGMMATMVPWAPVIAFMVASPLTSPEELFYSAAIFGWPFAIAFFVSSILLGLAGGMAAAFFEARGLLKNQTRFTAQQAASVAPSGCDCSKPLPARADIQPVLACACSQPVQAFAFAEPVQMCGCSEPVQSFGYSEPVQNCCSPEPVTTCGCSGTVQSLEVAPEPECSNCGTEPVKTGKLQSIPWVKLGSEFFSVGKRLLVMFLGFAFIGYFLNGLIPSEVIAGLFGIGNRYSIPLAATLGLPFYINTEASLPLLRGLIDGGMSQGAALAFLITGAGTSLGAISGALTIAKWRVIAIVVGTLWVGGIVLGYAYELLLTTSLI